MMLLRLSGHSGAGKSRLTAALPQRGISCPRAVLYTSRDARENEVDGKDYHFRSRETIEKLPREDFFVGPVDDMLQAVDLGKLQAELASNDLVLIEIAQSLSPGLADRLGERLGGRLRAASVFMTAVSPHDLHGLPDDEARGDHIQALVRAFLTWRNKDKPAKVETRSERAIKEILDAIGPNGTKQYARVFHSAPEGPNGQDEWTRKSQPVGRAKVVLDEFAAFFRSVNA